MHSILSLTLTSPNKHIDNEDCTYISSGGIINHDELPIKEGFIRVITHNSKYIGLNSDRTVSLSLNFRELRYYSPDEPSFVNATEIDKDIISIKSDGTVISMLKGEMKKKDFIMLTRGLDNYDHIIGLKKNGTIEFLEPDINDNCLPKGSDYISVASGWLHIISLRSNGTICVKEFGVNDSWGLTANTPSGNNFIAVAACDGNSCALTNDGVIYVWGRGYDEMKEFSAKDCINIIISNRIIIGLTLDGYQFICNLPMKDF
uniref:Regulator of chromosome condensation protein n=1 Tax=Pithovirus LCPAC406 TaxID=2506599 RepID=A0A481ZE90_9VIRU|nr:MAG: regulator of chromosome condensation protein [Pithovirus LCPAC406]